MIIFNWQPAVRRVCLRSQCISAVLIVLLAGSPSANSSLFASQDRSLEIDPATVAVDQVKTNNTVDIASADATNATDLRRLPSVVTATGPDNRIRLAAFDSDQDGLEPVSADEVAAEEIELAPGTYPIDLSNALGIGGADSLQIRLARTRLYEAQADHLAAKTLWLPSIRLGVGYNKHDGRLQETEGNVLEINRNSLFYGGGLGLGGAPLAAGAGGPPRLFVNLSMADAIFKPRAACQEVASFSAGARAAQNDALTQIAVAYYQLVSAYGTIAAARDAEGLSSKMVAEIEKFERQGFSSQTEISRAKANLAQWQQAVIEAERTATVRSAELARQLRLPPQVQLAPAEEFVLPIDYVDESNDIEALIAMGLRGRPEVSQFAALREAACWRVKEEKWRPFIPNVQVGASGGGFGGGPSTTFPGTASRSDVDLIAVWELQNMGAGNVALQRQRRGQLHQRVLDLEVVRDGIRAEVVAAAADVDSYRRQVEIAHDAITVAQQSYELNDQRIRESEGLPIELLQSIMALAEAQTAYAQAAANYNEAQYRLMGAMGNLVGR